jgi:alkylated DNA repair dioxygenase AlkB
LKKYKVRDGWIIWEPSFFTNEQASFHFKYLIDELPWSGGSIKLFGKEYEIPRKQVFFADEELGYGYSGKSLIKSPWDTEVLNIKTFVEQSADVDFNACLGNLYRNGQDSNGWHADNERELGVNPVIGSVSFGATRVFQLKHNQTKEKMSFNLSHGSLLIMGGAMQHNWKHQIPKTKRNIGPRINLTFRELFNQ